MDKNRKILFSVLGFAFFMVAVSFASVPLYRVFCQVMGWGGTTQRAAPATPGMAINRDMVVQFYAAVAHDMPWEFKPDVHQVRVKVGKNSIVSYSARNASRAPVAGTAVFNVTPLKAGKYFNKVQCFCFGEQILSPGQKVNMPVMFYIDPKIMDDRELKDLKTITLSYTFYRQDSPALEKAMEKFYSEGTEAPSAGKT